MPDYRLYYLNSDDRIVNAQSFEAESDDLAISCAEDAAGGGRAELWSGTRRIRIWADPSD